MTTIDIETFGNINAQGDIEMQVKRAFSWNSKISLTFIWKGEVILKSYYYSMLPFSQPKIVYSDLEDSITLANRGQCLHIDTHKIHILPYKFYWVTNHLCSIFIDDDKISEVYIKRNSSRGIELSCELKNIPEQFRLYSMILIGINFSDLDGGQ